MPIKSKHKPKRHALKQCNKQGDDLYKPISKKLQNPKVVITKDTVWTSTKLSQYIRQLFKKDDLSKVKVPDSIAAPIYSNMILKDWVSFERTIEEVNEYNKCKSDRYYFITSHCKKNLIDIHVVSYKFTDYLKDDGNKKILYYNKKVKDDDIDVTFMLAANLLWEVLFFDTRDCAVLFNTLKEEEDFLRYFVCLFSFIPPYLQRGVKSKTKHVISMNGDCNIYCYHGEEFASIYFVPDLLVANDINILNDNDYDRFIRLDIPKMSQDENTKLFATAGFVNFKGRFLENYDSVKGFDFSS